MILLKLASGLSWIQTVMRRVRISVPNIKMVRFIVRAIDYYQSIVNRSKEGIEAG